jgi:hypothetical protein
VTERPILFSAPMVRAILAGTKTQTRRVAKLPHENPLGKWEPTTFGGPNGGRAKRGETIPEHAALWHTRTGDSISARWIVGDRLWVRETWAVRHRYDHLGPSNIPVSGVNVHYAATEDRGGLRWRPSIHMCRWASRITLEVTGVRVERLQDISEADAVAEGIEAAAVEGRYRIYGRDTDGADMDTPRASYRSLWESINGPGSWDANPWVWCIEFRRAA